MSNKSSYSGDSSNNNKKKQIDTIPCRIEFIKKLLEGKSITSLVNFDNTDTECFIGASRDEDGSGESNDTRIVLQKRMCDFAKTIMSIGGDERQLEYIKSGTTGHTFRGTVNDKYGKFEYGVKVVAFPKKEKYGSIHDVRRPENAELKMIKVLSYFVVKRQTPHIVLPIGIFDTNIKIFTTEDFMEVVGEDNEKYQDFLTRYKNGDYDDTASVLISEWANRGDLLDFLRKFYNTPQFTAMHWKVIFFQFLSVLAVIQSKYPAFRHNDLKANNVLVHKIEKQEDTFAYRIAKKRYRVKNIGYQIKLWDFDFACIPGIVDNKKVELEWTKQINVTPKQNRYYDVHYFFNTLIKKGFVHGIMTSDTVPQEVKDFINRVLPKKYQNDPKAYELKKLINQKLMEKYKDLYEKYQELYAKSQPNQEKSQKSKKSKEYYDMAKKYSDLFNKCEDNDYGAKYIHNYYIPSEIKAAIMEIIPSNHGVLLGYVHEKGRLLIDDEYLTPQKILEEDPYFEEFRVTDEIPKNKETNKNLNSHNNRNTPDISAFLNSNSKTHKNKNDNNIHVDPFNNIMNLTGGIKEKEKEKNNKKDKNGSKKGSKKGTKKKSKKKGKKGTKSRTIDDEIKRVNIDDIFGD
jgi:hypothetical protein